MYSYRFPKFIVFVSGKIRRNSSVYYKTSKYGRIFECNYDPQNPPRNTERKRQGRANMALATALAKLDYYQYLNERAKFDAEFKNQHKYKFLFHYIVAQHRLALERANRPCKPNLRDIAWLRTIFLTEILLATSSITHRDGSMETGTITNKLSKKTLLRARIGP